MINFSLAPHSAGAFSLCFLVAELVCVPGCLCVFVCVGGRDFMFYMFQTSFQVSDFFFGLLIHSHGVLHSWLEHLSWYNCFNPFQFKGTPLWITVFLDMPGELGLGLGIRWKRNSWYFHQTFACMCLACECVIFIVFGAIQWSLRNSSRMWRKSLDNLICFAIQKEKKFSHYFRNGGSHIQKLDRV